MSRQVLFAGFVDPTDLPAFLDVLDVLLNPNLYQGEVSSGLFYV